MDRPSTKVMVGIPTTRCERYIAQSLDKLVVEMDLIDRSLFDASLAICLNGPDQDASEAAIRSWMSRTRASRPDFQIIFLRTERPGKNGAINLVLEAARSAGHQYLQLMDDDVEFESGSIDSNFRQLHSEREAGERLVLVASRFYAKKQALRDFAQKPSHLLTGLVRWFNYKIVSIPFCAEAEPWLACSGQSLAMFVNTAPRLPEDSTGITDDTFLSCYYALNGHIVKPKNSIVYFKVSTYLSEWLAQQLRIYSGVEKAYDHFGKRKPALERIFAWPYSPQPSRRTPLQTTSTIRRLKYQVFKLYCLRLHRSIELLQFNQTPIGWNRAESTK